ncbi:MAG: hypothetical protein V7640_1133 [Betaproteobacteria bacterium]
MRALYGVVFAAVFAAFCAVAASAQAYPAKHVRVITAGAGTFHDIVMRHLGQRLAEKWKQQVVVENRGALLVGSSIAARSTPDGYTLLMADRTSHAVYPNLYRQLPYSALDDFAPITPVARAPLMLVAHPLLAVANLREFLEYARRRPGVVNYANSGNGTASHIAGEQLKQLAAIHLVPIQYKGGGAAMLAILSGEAQVGFSVITVALPHLSTGRVKTFGIASAKRFEGAPDIPTIAEAGLPGFESELWVGLFAPARTPWASILKIHRDVDEVLQRSDMRLAMLAQGAEPARGSPQEFGAFIKSEIAKMKNVIETAGIKAE